MEGSFLGCHEVGLPKLDGVIQKDLGKWDSMSMPDGGQDERLGLEERLCNSTLRFWITLQLKILGASAR